MIDAAAPYTVKTGTAAAFVTTPAAPNINEATIHYIEVYVPEHSGEHLELHVTTGLAPVDYLKKMVAARLRISPSLHQGHLFFILATSERRRQNSRNWT